MAGRNAEDAAGVGVERNGEAIGLGSGVSAGDKVVQFGWSAVGEVCIAQSVNLAPGELEFGGGLGEVEEGEDSGTIVVGCEPGLLRLVAQMLNVERAGGNACLIDGNDLAVGDQCEVGGVHLREVGAEVERRAGDGPEGEHGLALVWSEAVLVAVAEFESVEIVPSAAPLPSGPA